MPLRTPLNFVIAGRFVLALYFLLPGLMKFAAWDMHIDLMQGHGVPFAAPLLLFAGIANVAGAFLLITKRHVRLTALGFVLYIVLVNVTLHDFWNYEGVKGQHEMQNFIKNLGILAGCLVLAGASKARGLKLADLLKSDAKV